MELLSLLQVRREMSWPPKYGMYIATGRTNPPVGYPWLKLSIDTLFDLIDTQLIMYFQERHHLSGESKILCNSVIVWLDSWKLNVFKRVEWNLGLKFQVQLMKQLALTRRMTTHFGRIPSRRIWMIQVLPSNCWIDMENLLLVTQR